MRMTNKQYKKIDKILATARSKGELTADELKAARECLQGAEPCIGCKYNDGHEHNECYDIEHCRIMQMEAEFDK